MLVTIVNHQYNDQAVELVKGFRPQAEVIAIDSGSTLDERHNPFFDLKLPNVYYSGLVNAAYQELSDRPNHAILYFICSDVRFDDFASTIAYAKSAFEDPQVGVYAPSVNISGHPQMLCHQTGDLRPVVFVEGICFAVRLSLLEQLCPINTEVNYLGWGLDVYLGFLAMQAGLTSVVDDRLTIYHQADCGYDTAQARQQRDRWIAQQSQSAQRFQKITGFKPLKNRLGLWLLQRMNWA